jgi:ferritin-like metal-binding protein YciE
MPIFSSTNLRSLDGLLVEQLKDLYDAESRLLVALPEMAEAASSTDLKRAFQSHLGETQDHVRRLDQVFNILGEGPETTTCEAMKGLLKEGKEMIEAKGDPNVKDAALIASAQRVEHYEIASYGTARTFAERLGHVEAARILQQTLDEEGAADKKLTQIAEDSINWKASVAS